MSDKDFFDFGFTAMDEDELDIVQSASQTAGELQETKEKLEKLHKAILPLLANLEKNPTKPYIYWADRKEKIQQFRKHLQSIVS